MTNSVNTWSTRDVAPRRAMDYWNELLSDKVLRMTVQSHTSRAFGGRITGANLGCGRMYHIAAADDQDARHGRTNVAQRGDDAVCLVHMRAGAFRIEAGAREADLVLGDCVLLDSKECFRFRLPERSASLVLRFTSHWLRRWLPHYEDATAIRIAGDGGWGRALSNVLINLEPAWLDGLPLTSSDVADQVGGLLALACGTTTFGTSHTRALLRRMVSLIHERATEPQLTPAAVAAAVGISRRYLHKLLAGDGTTFNTLLYAARLRIATRLLGNPRLHHLTIAEIAISAGFADASHLSRHLRSRHGMSPGAFRAAC